MTIEEAIQEYDEIVVDYAAHLIDNHCSPEVQQELEHQYHLFVMGRDALRAQQEQPNEPLTLEELREMDGEPVWVQDLLISRCSAWHFVIKHDGEIRLFDAVAFGRKILGCNATTGENYGKTWLAYRRKPEQEESN